MHVEITALYAALLGIWLFVLSVRVIQFRRQGDAADPVALERSVRAQGNLAEYAPTFLILLLLSELLGASAAWLYGIGGIFLVGRLMHGAVFAFLAPNMLLRVGGMALTFTGLLAASGLALVSALG